ncbi:MAG: hypothetical protein R3C14_44730 [Caldilineaceae bacterium]
MALQGQTRPNPGFVQRDNNQGAAQGGNKTESQHGKDKDKGFDLDQWLQSAIYNLVKEQLGEEKLQTHAKAVVDKAVAALMAQVRDATSEADFVQKAQINQIGTILAGDLKRIAAELLKSPDGQRARQAILKVAKDDPGLVIILALLGVAAAAAANADIPEFKREFNIGAGFKASGQAKLGKFQALALQHLQAGLSYTSKYFAASLQGSYTGEGEKSGFGANAEATIGTKELKLKTQAVVLPDGNYQLSLRPMLDLKQLQGSVGATWDAQKGLMGEAQLTLRDKDLQMTVAGTIDQDGKLTLKPSLKVQKLFGIKPLSADLSLQVTPGADPAPKGNLAIKYETAGVNLQLSGTLQPTDPVAHTGSTIIFGLVIPLSR